MSTFDLDDDPEGNVQHIAEHEISKDEVEEVLQNPKNPVANSDSSGRPVFERSVSRSRVGRSR